VHQFAPAFWYTIHTQRPSVLHHPSCIHWTPPPQGKELQAREAGTQGNFQHGVRAHGETDAADCAVVIRAVPVPRIAGSASPDRLLRFLNYFKRFWSAELLDVSTFCGFSLDQSGFKKSESLDRTGETGLSADLLNFFFCHGVLIFFELQERSDSRALEPYIVGFFSLIQGGDEAEADANCLLCLFLVEPDRQVDLLERKL
jgi:hypothetical protein